MDFRFRSITEADAAWAGRLNNEAVPHVNSLTETDLQQLVTGASWSRMSTLDHRPCGFVIAFADSDDYDSDNFRWFKRWHRGFLYVDRLVVAADCRRQGVANALYADMEAAARRRFAALVCEVNLVPANPGSLSFHMRHGFRSLCSRRNAPSGKRVLMLRKSVW